MSKTLLFFYGTLKRGQRNHYLLAGQEFLGEAITMPLYRLHAVSSYPGMTLDQDDGLSVKGELWAIDDATLTRLDEFEGVPEWFIRADIAVRDCFETVQAYLYNKPISSGVISSDEWPFAV
jgi:gamma-glutamylcyclotransferase (GGCT)/AIG2-like uncharacterized protein YtfP